MFVSFFVAKEFLKKVRIVFSSLFCKAKPVQLVFNTDLESRSSKSEFNWYNST